jgi:hypothetical protein
MKIILNLLRRLWQSDQWALRTSRLPPKNRIVPAWPILSACYRTKIKATHRASNNGVNRRRENVGASACHYTSESMSTRTILSDSPVDSTASTVNRDVVTT